jgi:sugar lactone lactonase YvrE
VYVVHHGFRESIEIFEVDRKDPSAFTWIGCVIAPPNTELNSVAPLPDGGLVATNSYGRDPEARIRAPRGINTGEVWEWHAAGGWRVVSGTESPGPNGIEVSKDGKWLYVNLWPVRKVMRFSRGQTPARRDVLDVPFHPDNIRWQADGSLLSAGHHGPPPIARTRECLRTKCADAAARVIRVDPDKFTFQEVVTYPSTDVFFGATSALQVGREIWIGSVRGDRIARFPLP